MLTLLFAVFQFHAILHAYGRMELHHVRVLRAVEETAHATHQPQAPKHRTWAQTFPVSSQRIVTMPGFLSCKSIDTHDRLCFQCILGCCKASCINVWNLSFPMYTRHACCSANCINVRNLCTAPSYTKRVAAPTEVLGAECYLVSWWLVLSPASLVLAPVFLSEVDSVLSDPGDMPTWAAWGPEGREWRTQLSAGISSTIS